MNDIGSIGDLWRELEEHEALLNSQVYIADDYIVINIEHEYNIELNRCDTHEKILGWASHLCEKTWMNLNVMERFIQLAAAHHNLRVPST